MSKQKLALLAALLCISVGAHAEYPDKPIRLIVAWPPGGVTDTVGRLLAQGLTGILKQSVVVENRPGANGIVGTKVAMAAPADGYTIEMATAETHAIDPYVYPDANYSATQSFDPVAMLATAAFVLAERGQFPPNNVAELIKLAKSKPNQINAGSYGVGSTSHLGLALFQQVTGTQFQHVPYLGVAPVVNALVAGQVDIAFVNAFNVAGFAKLQRH